MAERLLQLDDLRTIDSPERIASMFRKLGYVKASCYPTVKKRVFRRKKPSKLAV